MTEINISRIEKLNDVLNYDNNDVLNKIINTCNLSKNEAKQLFFDLKAFLYLATISKEKIAPTVRIDNAWHAFLLHTKDYGSFCQQYFGKFIHHSPYKSESQRIQQGKLAYQHAISLAKSVLGENISKNWDLTSSNSDFDCSPDFDCDSEGGGESDPSDWN